MLGRRTLELSSFGMNLVEIPPGEAIPVRNDGDEPALVLIASAPRGSGYTPLEWA